MTAVCLSVDGHRQARNHEKPTQGQYAGDVFTTKSMRTLRGIAIARAVAAGSQNFLGAPWVEFAVGKSPAWIRRSVALRLLSLSPHYFYDGDLRAEDERNRRSRQALADELVARYVGAQTRVLDYGCGPGYMAYSVAERAAHVDAVDVSRGVLACAKVLNSRYNVNYHRLDECWHLSQRVDLAYSFAVAQHLQDATLLQALRFIAENLCPGGILLLHFAIPSPKGYRTEAEWMADRSLVGRARLRFGLHCFGRSPEDMNSLVASCGFTDIDIRPLGGTIVIPGDDDITQQHWLTARRELA